MRENRTGALRFVTGKVCALLFVLSLGMSADAVAGRQVEVVAAVANVRAEASPTAKVEFRLNKGDFARLIEIRGDWYLIEDSTGRRGYIFKTVVQLGPEPVAKPIEAPAPPPPPEQVALEIDHKPVDCIVAEQYPKLDACLVPEANVGRGYIHFRTLASEPWYAVELTRDGPCFSTFLPKPMRGTREIQYYVDVVDRAMTERQQPTGAPRGAYHAKVVGKESDCEKLAKLAVRFAKPAYAIVVSVARDAAGKTLDAVAAGQMEKSALLAGFRSEGVVIGSTGAPPSAPSSATTSTTAGATGGAKSTVGGLSTKTLVLAGAGVAVAGGVGIALAVGGSDGDGTSSSPPKDPLTIDNDGDGLSENQGDCNDANPSVKPGGGVTAQQQINASDYQCNTVETYSLTVTNNSCSAVSVQTIRGTLVRTGGSCFACDEGTDSFAPKASSVPAGQTVTVDSYTGPAGCCGQGLSCASACDCQWSYAVQVETSAGTIGAGAISYRVTLDNTCATCATSSTGSTPMFGAGGIQ